MTLMCFMVVHVLRKLNCRSIWIVFLAILLLVAKNDFAHQALADQLKDHSLSRVYECITVGGIREDSGTIDAPCDGMISGIDKDSAHLLSADDGHWRGNTYRADLDYQPDL